MATTTAHLNFRASPEVVKAIEDERKRLSKLLHGSPVTLSTALRSLICRPEPTDAT